MPEVEKPDEQQPPKVTEAGVAIYGEYPANHRLRAEALAADGKDEDPDGIVAPELIADAGKRMKAEKPAPKSKKGAPKVDDNNPADPAGQ